MKQIFLVEDDKEIAKNLILLLRSEGFRVTYASSQKEAISMLSEHTFDLSLIDLSLPDGNGFTICTEIKQQSKIPVIFLTASGDEASVVTGLNLGADDYITKPFNIKIVMQRIQAILRRCKPKEIDLTMFTFGDLTIDFNTMQVKKQNVLLSLTPTELKLLFIFCKNRGKVLTRQLLLQKLWDQDGNFVDEHTLTINISRLRKKIESDSDIYIKTVYGIGYQWIKEETTI